MSERPDKQELKPCPFCGHTRIMVDSNEVWCLKCAANMPFLTEKDGIRRWNLRAGEKKEEGE